MRLSGLAISGLLLAGCQSVPAPGGPVACGAPGYQDLLGRNIAAVKLPADLPVRLIRPGDVVTTG